MLIVLQYLILINKITTSKFNYIKILVNDQFEENITDYVITRQYSPKTLLNVLNYIQMIKLLFNIIDKPSDSKINQFVINEMHILLQILSFKSQQSASNSVYYPDPQCTRFT
ncbi:unnamed protein product [Paramecium sonneborni]|uniref:Uncharacterized protein n=1 Tax=Paramecium sonneborni TaxID=65129 RepID=A0A8S1LB48_9CILI|nr:unnamed protein product [Paramecium sonneborni]